MKYFCSKCGKTTQYGFELPKFCAFCGQSFANKPSSVKAEETRNKFLNELKLRKNTNKTEEEENESFDENLNTNFKSIKAKFKLDIYQSKGESFKDLIDNPLEPVNESFNTEKPRQRTSEEILEDFKRESASIRNNE